MGNDHHAGYNDLIGDMLKKQENQGDITQLPGSGKPLEKAYLSGDTFQHFQRIAKDAGYKPYWLKLQHEMKDHLSVIVEQYRAGHMNEVNESIKNLNHQLIEYNKVCPPPMQKSPVTVETIQKLSKE